MSDGTSDGLLFPELRRNSRDGQMTENICCASACDDTGTSAVLCLQLILAQRGDTGVCSLGSFIALRKRALRILCL